MKQSKELESGATRCFRQDDWGRLHEEQLSGVLHT